LANEGNCNYSGIMKRIDIEVEIIYRDNQKVNFHLLLQIVYLILRFLGSSFLNSLIRSSLSGKMEDEK
jgi:hypothetical protein